MGCIVLIIYELQFTLPACRLINYFLLLGGSAVIGYNCFFTAKDIINTYFHYIITSYVHYC